MEDTDWTDILKNINEKECTPFIGEGASASWLYLGRDLASKWADQHGYPLPLEDLEESYRLTSVAQFMAIKKRDPNEPKNLLSEYIKEKDKDKPDFSLDEYKTTPYAVLADLNLPIYITTNYDLLMESALEKKGKKPISEFCRWNNDLKALAKLPDFAPVFDRKYRYRPTSDQPLVYHLLGLYLLRGRYRLTDKDQDVVENKMLPSSMVLTEKDYIDFVIFLNKEDEKTIFPPVIREALARHSLLFIGYKLEDISFRVIFQGVVSFQASYRKKGLAVQLPPSIAKSKQEQAVGKQEQAEEYLEQYTKDMYKVSVYLGDSAKFSEELHQRWDNFKKR